MRCGLSRLLPPLLISNNPPIAAHVQDGSSQLRKAQWLVHSLVFWQYEGTLVVAFVASSAVISFRSSSSFIRFLSTQRNRLQPVQYMLVIWPQRLHLVRWRFLISPVLSSLTSWISIKQTHSNTALAAQMIQLLLGGWLFLLAWCEAGSNTPTQTFDGVDKTPTWTSSILRTVIDDDDWVASTVHFHPLNVCNTGALGRLHRICEGHSMGVSISPMTHGVVPFVGVFLRPFNVIQMQHV